MNADDIKALSIVSHLMTIEILALLMNKGIIAAPEAKELVDRCLLNLETNAAFAAADDVLATELAQALCEKILVRLGG